MGSEEATLSKHGKIWLEIMFGKVRERAARQKRVEGGREKRKEDKEFKASVGYVLR